MSFEDKVASAEVVKEGYMPKGDIVKTKGQRIKGILISFLVAAYVIALTILKLKKMDFDMDFNAKMIADKIVIILSFTSAALKIIFSIILAFLNKSVYSLNHYKTYKILEVLANLNLLVVFFVSFYNYTTLLMLETGVNSIFTKEFYRKVFQDQETTKNVIMLALTIIINVPLLLKFISFSLKTGGKLYISAFLTPFAPIFILKYLSKENRTFYQFESYDDKKYIIREMRITTKGYGVMIFFRKLISLVLLFGLTFLVTYLIYKNLYTTFDQKTKWYIFFSIYGSYGFMVNVIYFYSNIDMSVNKTREDKIMRYAKDVNSIFGQAKGLILDTNDLMFYFGRAYDEAFEKANLKFRTRVDHSKYPYIDRSNINLIRMRLKENYPKLKVDKYINFVCDYAHDKIQRGSFDFNLYFFTFIKKANETHKLYLMTDYLEEEVNEYFKAKKQAYKKFFANGLYNTIVIAKDKGEAYPVKAILKKTGLKPEEVLFISNSNLRTEAAIRLNLKTIFISNKDKTTDIIEDRSIYITKDYYTLLKVI